jgi:hypothetical protein
MYPYPDSFSDPMDGFAYDPRGGYTTMPATAPGPEAPVPQAADFDYTRDIAPHAGRFLGEIAGDRRLSAGAKSRLQAQLIGTVDAIGERRANLEKQRTSSALDQIRLESSQLALLDARDRRSRTLQDAGRMASLSGEIDALLRSDLPEENKQQALAELEWANSDLVATDPRAARRFQIAGRTINPPKPEREWLTPDKFIDMVSKGVPPQILATGDPSIIGAALYEVMQVQREADRTSTEMSKDQAVLRKQAQDLLEAEFRLGPAKDGDGQPLLGPDNTPIIQLDDAKRARAQEVVVLWGNEEDKEEWFSLPEGPDGDKMRANLATRVQLQKRVSLLESKLDPSLALAEDLVPD